MILAGETFEYAAEVPFFLPLDSDPTGPDGLTLHAFHDVGDGTTDEVQVFIPGALVFANATIAKIREVGHGRYALRLTHAQSLLGGAVLLRTNVAGTQRDFVVEVIGQASGDIPVGGDGYFVFYLPDAVDPIGAPPITGHAFAPGEVELCLPNGVYANATVGDIAEFGDGGYGLKLTAAAGQTLLRGKAYLYANVAGAQRFEGYITILGAPTAGTSPPPPPPPPPGPSVVLTPSPVVFVDHGDAAVNRLVEQFRGKPRIEAFLRALCEPMNDLDQAFVDMITKTSIDNAVGDQLEQLRKKVGQPPADVPTETMRAFIRARIRTNKSSGLGNQILQIARLVLKAYAAQPAVLAAGDLRIRAHNHGYAGATLEIQGVDLDWTLADFLLHSFLQVAIGTAIDVQLVFFVQHGAVYDDHSARPFTLGDVNAAVAEGLGLGDVNDPTTGGVLAAAME